jgi:hypothetical protein
MEKQDFKRVEKFEKERSMKKTGLAVLLATLVLVVPRSEGQDKEKSAADARSAQTEKAMTPLRVQVSFTEFDGEKKIGNLPYTFLVNADDRGARAAVRMGLRVPIEASSSNTGVKQIQYTDVGTSLDGRAEKTEDGRFLLMLSVEKSSAYLPGANEKPASVGGNEISSAQPTIQQFRTQVNLLIRDGQTIQSTVATDPVTGHVTKVDVTLNVIK